MEAALEKVRYVLASFRGGFPPLLKDEVGYVPLILEKRKGVVSDYHPCVVLIVFTGQEDP